RGVTPLEIALPVGKRLVELSLKDHESAVRTVDCAAPSASADFKLAPVTAPVLIVTEPAGASVTLDGANRGVTPLLLPEVKIGRYRVELAIGGYKPQQIELSVSSPTPQQIKVALVNSAATLNITSTPSGASVSVNGIHRGAAPVTVDKIQEGKSIVEITSAGYAPYKEEVTLAAGEVFAIHAQLSALPARLRIVSEPAGAKVYIDNQLRGNTPLTIDEIAAGSYRVRVEATSYETMARTVDLQNNQMLTEEFKLAQTIGSIRLATSPADVSIYIGGKLFGKTAADADSTDQISETLEIDGVPAGENEILFERQGYKQETRTVTVERGQTLVIETVKLPRLFVPDVEVTTKHGTYKGVYVNRDQEFYRIETSPGVIRAFPVGDIIRIRPIRAEENKEADAAGLGKQ
ncbi:MAG: PEGA domain-containing protein, partial [Kiritimatiellaeota bacterium]|nr:PEGA domain-containing protein [Kiritimatiellota bacterium]